MSRTKGYKHSEESKRKISLALMGHPITEKVREAFRKSGKERFGDKNPSWKGGRRIQNGYVIIWTGPRRKRLEHVMVMEKHLGRKLKLSFRGGKGNVIHHKNGDKSDNRIENLQLFPSHSSHVKEEQRLNSFAKQVLFGNILDDDLKDKLSRIYSSFQVKQQ